MAIFEFSCPNGHVTEGHYALADRPKSIICEHEQEPGLMCGLDAPHVMSATPTTFRHADRKAFKRPNR